MRHLFISRLTFPFLFFFLTMTALFGCVIGPSPYLPKDWVSQPVELDSIMEPHTSKLQIIITYSGLESSHTALRVISPEGQVVFWDPGGDYGRFDDDWNAQYGSLPIGVQRKNDLILTNPPDIGTFVRWRWTIQDTRVEVFEWDLPTWQGRKLSNILRDGTDDTHPAGSFSTWTFPLMCTMATSDFIRRFASPTIQLSERYFFPDNLAERLYTQSPSRVRVFTLDGQKTVYVPPGPKSVQHKPR